MPPTFDIYPYRKPATILAVLPDEQLAEIESHLSSLTSGPPADDTALTDLRFLILPTRAAQETSISSGQGRQFIPLSARFDRAAACT